MGFTVFIDQATNGAPCGIIDTGYPAGTNGDETIRPLGYTGKHRRGRSCRN